MLEPQIIAYINTCLYYGKTYEQVREELINSGWPIEKANEVINEYHQAYYKKENKQENKKTNTKTILILVFLLILTISIGLLAWFLFFYNNDSNDPINSEDLCEFESKRICNGNLLYERITDKNCEITQTLVENCIQGCKDNKCIAITNSSNTNQNQTENNKKNNFEELLIGAKQKENKTVLIKRTEINKGFAYERNTNFKLIFEKKDSAKLVIKNNYERFNASKSNITIEGEEAENNINFVMSKYDNLGCSCEIKLTELTDILNEMNERYSFVNYEVTFKRFDELSISCRGLLYELVKGDYVSNKR